MTAALRRALPQWRIPRPAVFIGSVAPDIPLYLLTAGALVYFTQVEGWSTADATRHIFGTLYFDDIGWIAAHSALHSPVVLVAALAAMRTAAARKWTKAANWLSWFFAACLLHAIVDIATHYDDGPLVFWPLDWTVRFYSPISYWDPSHLGRQFTVFEIFFDGVCIAYLGAPWLWRRFRGDRNSKIQGTQ